MLPKVRKPVPKRAIPNKPLPNRPLPSGPSPQVLQHKPEPQPVNEPEAEPQPEPEAPQKEENVQAAQEDQKQLTADPDAAQPKLQETASNPNWYKPRQKQEKSYRAAKTCKLLLDDKKHMQKKVKLFQTYDQFFVAEGNMKNKGFCVASICNNECGAAFKKMGIGSGWRVIKIGNKPLQYISFAMLKNKIISAGQKAGDKGYYLVFDGSPPKEEDEKESEENVEGIIVAPVAAKASVELLSSYNDHKVVKLHNSMETYVDFEAVKGPKGYKISGFKAKFGADLKQHGVDLGWRVMKLGDENVSNLFTQKIKTKLDVEWKNNKADGLKVTFGQPL